MRVVVLAPRSELGLLALALLWAAGCPGPPPNRPDGGSRDSGAGGGGGGGGTRICLDNDGDGAPGTGDCADFPQPDCDDADPSVSPKAQESCDGKDNNCNLSADEGLPLNDFFLDGDGDGYGAGLPETTCQASIPGKISKSGDCDDQDKNVFPGASEACNQRDDNCNGQVDENVQTRSFYTDGDGDGFGAGAPTQSCQSSLPGKVTQGGDCDDGNASIHPNGNEICNGKDDDCDGSTDETFPGQGNACATGELGVCAPGTNQCQGGVTKCVRNVNPSAELCDGLDNDCDNLADETFSNLGQACNSGVGVCQRSGGFVCKADKTGTECNATPGQPTAAACDTLDNDCDGRTDELETVRHADVATAFDPTAIEVAPFFYTSTSCNGGQGASGTDAFQRYVAAYLLGNELYVQEIRGDGTVVSQTPFAAPSPFSSYTRVAIAQAGSGLAIAVRWSSSYIDLYYVGPGPSARTLGGGDYFGYYSVTSPATIGEMEMVRGNGGRVILLWRENNGSGGTKIRFGRISFSGSGSAFTVNTVTAPTDLITAAGNNGAFGAASSHEEYGDTLGCPLGLARFAVAYRQSETLRLATFNEDGTPVGGGNTIYTGAASYSPRNPDVAWTYVSGDRWAVAFSVGWSSTNDEGLYFWQSAGSYTVFGGYHNGNGASSVAQPRLAARPTEFLLGALIYGTTTLSAEPQIRMGKVSLSGATVVPLSQATVYSGCTGANCVNGTKKLARPLSSSSGSLKTDGAVLYGSSQGKVSSSVIGCN
ncbi:MAG: putative metal-binding motif-containing protein [Myxococcales bacterium]|nr:putative metal-binding motif-containing protein [Myxococcales bacterium]